MRRLKNKLFITITLVLISVIVIHIYTSQQKQSLIDFEQVQLTARNYMNTNLGTDYSKYGYCTLFIDDNHALSSFAIVFIFGKYTAYAVLFDKNGVLKNGTRISTSYGTSSLEDYKNRRSVAVVKGIYGTYLLTDDDSLVYTGVNYDDLLDTDKIDFSIINSEFILREYGIDVSELYNYKITKKNNGE
jgi:hypothetical protein